ncbi:MAG TPA: hypothetical protein VFY67_05815, partial [Pyrinomonadaceae bacterium]|nr:hypothetical protein [Pyrinomonadaceae bacterium]
MKRKLLNLALILMTALTAASIGQAQTRGRNVAATVSPGLMGSLPESDAVAHVKMKQLLSEAMPRMLANNPVKLADVNAGIDRFKDRTGL